MSDDRIERSLDPKLGERLKRIYGLKREPKSADEFYTLARARRSEVPEMEAYIDRIRRGKAVMGETAADRGYSVKSGARKTNVMCGYDAVITSVLQGSGLTRGRCPHCGEAMEIDIVDRELAKVAPASVIFWLGTGPRMETEHPVCDHLHLFPDVGHLEAWLDGRPDELGFAMPIQELVGLLVQVSEA